MFAELDIVVLARDLKAQNLKAGDLGTVVHVYHGGMAIEIEFVTVKGKTVATLTLSPRDVRPIARDEILHVRGSAAA